MRKTKTVISTDELAKTLLHHNSRLFLKQIFIISISSFSYTSKL